MNILLVHPNDLLTTPTTVRIIRLAQELSKRGHRCTLAYFIEQARREQKMFTQNIEDIEQGIHTLGLNPMNPVANTLTLKKLAQEHDFIHLQKAIPYAALPAITAAYLAGIPLHYDWDDYEEELALLIHRKKLYPHAIRQFERRLPAFASSLTYASEALFELAVQRGAAPELCTWLPVGADIPKKVDRPKINKNPTDLCQE